MLRREAYLSDAEFETVGYPASHLARPSLYHRHLETQVSTQGSVADRSIHVCMFLVESDMAEFAESQSRGSCLLHRMTADRQSLGALQ